MSARQDRVAIRYVQREPIYERADHAVDLIEHARGSSPVGTIVPPLHVWLARQGLILIHSEEGSLAVLADWRAGRAGLRRLRRTGPRNLDDWKAGVRSDRPVAL